MSELEPLSWKRRGGGFGVINGGGADLLGRLQVIRARVDDEGVDRWRL